MKMLSVVLIASMLPMAACGYGQSATEGAATAPTAEPKVYTGTVELRGMGNVNPATDETGVFRDVKLNFPKDRRYELAQADNKSVDDTIHTLTVLVAPKMVKAAYMGVTVAGADKTLQSQLKLPEGMGLVIQNVEEKSPAASAGLKENDVITRFGDQMVINADQFEVLVRTHKAGEAVEVTVIREAEAIKMTVTLAEKEEPELSWVLNSHRQFSFSPAQTVNGGTLLLRGAGNTTAPPAPVVPAK